jgi:hypothetical protein
MRLATIVAVPLAAAALAGGCRGGGEGAAALRRLPDRSLSVTIYSAPPPKEDPDEAWAREEYGAAYRDVLERQRRRVATQLALYARAREAGEDVTPYGIGVVQDERLVRLPRGVSEYRFADVARHIEPETVRLRCVDPADSVVALEQSYEYDLASSDAVLAKYVDRDVTVELDGGARVTGALLARDLEAWQLVLGLATGEIEIVCMGDVSRTLLPNLPAGLLTRPTLSWILESRTEGAARLRASYRTRGLVWEAGYTLVLAPDTRSAALAGVATIGNASGIRFEDARLKLVAGDVNLIEPVELLGDEVGGAPGLCLVASDEPEERFVEKKFSEYHLYTLGRRCTIGENEVKQIELFAPALAVPAKVSYVYEARTLPRNHARAGQWLEPHGEVESGSAVDVYLTFRNDEASGLGIPLPAGPVRVFSRDPGDGALEFTGEAEIGHTPRGEELTLRVGASSDLVGERIVTDARIGYDDRWRAESVEIRLRNHKGKPVEICVKESMYRCVNWEITRCSAQPSRRAPSGGASGPETAWQRAIRSDAGRWRVNARFDRVPLVDVVRALDDLTVVRIDLECPEGHEDLAERPVVADFFDGDLCTAVAQVAELASLHVGLALDEDIVLLTPRAASLRCDVHADASAPGWWRLAGEAAGHQTVTLEFNDTPLNEVVAFLRERFHVPLALERVRPGDMSNETPVTVSFREVYLPAAIETIAEMCGLRADLVEGTVLLTSSAAARKAGPECLRTYDVSACGDASSMAEWIMRRVRPASWAPELGTSIEVRGGSLLIQQTPEVHAIIAQMLAMAAKASDDRTVEFRVTVPADSERTITYTAVYTW